MIVDEERKKLAEQILKNGWIEATPENIKAYMDGFEMAKNKSYEETGITCDEYLKKLAEHESHPIHIITSREILESDMQNQVSLEDIGNVQTLITNLEKDEISSNKTH